MFNKYMVFLKREKKYMVTNKIYNLPMNSY